MQNRWRNGFGQNPGDTGASGLFAGKLVAIGARHDKTGACL